MYHTITIRLSKVTDIYKLCSLTKQLKSDIQINKHGFKRVVDGKSILGIFSLGTSDLLDISIVNPSDEELIKFNEIIKSF